MLAQWAPSAERMIAPCVVHIPLRRIPAHVVVVRGGTRLHNPPKPTKTPPSGTTPPTAASPGAQQSLFLRVGDQIIVRPPAVFTFSYGGNRYKIPHANLTLKCRSLRIGHTAA